MASRQRSGRVRSVGDPAGAGRLSESDPLHGHGGENLHRPICHRRHHGPVHRVHSQPAEEQAVLPDVASQGAAPAVGARRGASRGIRQSLDPRAGHVLGRLRHPDGRAARKPAARGRRSEQPRPQAAAAAGPDRPGTDHLADHEAGVRHDSPWQRDGDADRRGAGALEVSALHAGLSRDRAVARRQHRTAARLPRRVGALAEHHRHLHQRPGLLPRRSRPLRQALHVRRSAADAVSRALARRASNPARGAARSP